MTVGLRKIAQHAAGQRIELFGEQTDVIAAREQTVEQLAGFRIAALQYVVIDEPKAARQESSFTCGQAVAGVFGFVAQNEFIRRSAVSPRSPEAFLGPADRLGRKKADQRDQQQTGIEPLGAVGLHKAVKVAVETALTDFGMDFVGDLAPSPP